MTEVMQPIAPRVLPETWVTALKARIMDALGNALPGHCLRVSGLPRPIMEQAAKELFDRKVRPDVYLVDTQIGPEPWRIGVHKVVERRNDGSSVVVALIPPDVQLAAGDSVDINTFHEIPLAGLDTQVEKMMADRLPDALKPAVTEVLNALRRHKWPLPASARLEYLATIAHQRTDDTRWVGGALFALGLVPDFELLAQPEQLPYRLGTRNILVVEKLRQEGATPLERIFRLPLRDEAFRSQLVSFFGDRQLEDTRAWGKEVSIDKRWRGLALEHWPMGNADFDGRVRVYLGTLRLPKREDGMLFYQAPQTVRLTWQTDPKPLSVPGLEYFRVELLSSEREVMWESPLLKRGNSTQARRTHTIRQLHVDSGVYFLRVVALNAAGEPMVEQELRDPTNPNGKYTNESEDFYVLSPDDTLPPGERPKAVVNKRVSSYAEAELLARWPGEGQNAPIPEDVGLKWATPLMDGKGGIVTASISFDIRREFTIQLSRRLAHLELEILRAPEQSGHFRLHLDHEIGEPSPLPLAMPYELSDARQEVFAAILRTKMENDGHPLTVLADLCAAAPAIERYAQTYIEWLEGGAGDALMLDLVLVEIPECGAAALMAPTHPLRLLWALQKQEAARAWTAEATKRGATEAGPRAVWQTLAAHGVPPFVVLDASMGFIDAGPLPGGWGAYIPPDVPDSRAATALLRERLGCGAAYSSGADVPPDVLADKLAHFIRQHPYTPALILNVVNPGDANLVVAALVELERRLGSQADSGLRYNVRLITEAARQDGVGSAFRELLDPETQIPEAADRLVLPGASFLFPKLSWSRHHVRDFLKSPSQFAAHVTILLDAFPVGFRLARVDASERSSFMHGLVQDAPRRFVGRGRGYTWLRRSSPCAGVELAESPGRSALIARMIASIGRIQARILAGDADTNTMTAAVALDLGTEGRSLLNAAHTASPWVLTLDPNLGLDYFDLAARAEAPGYLLDFTPEFVATGARQLLLTTRVGNEVARLMAPAAEQLGLDESSDGASFLMEMLRSLSGRLGLRLLSSPAQVQGALGMALSRVFLEAYGLLDGTLVIPLDAHPELVRREEPDAPQLRGDLLLVTAKPDERRLELVLVEAKCHGGAGLGDGLREVIAAQLGNSESALRGLFDPSLSEPDRIDRVAQSWRLSNVLEFYLDRAVRYGLIADEQRRGLRPFLNDLETGYSLSFQKVGLVFHLDGRHTALDDTLPDLPIWVVGKAEIQRIVTEGLRCFAERVHLDRAQKPHGDGGPEAPPATPTMRDDPTWDRVRQVFTTTKAPAGGKERRKPSARKPTPPDEAPVDMPSERTPVVPEPKVSAPGPEGPSGEQRDTSRATPEPEEIGAPETPVTGVRDKPQPPLSPSPQPPEAPKGERTRRTSRAAANEPVASASAQPEYAVLLGDTKVSPQYGLLGAVASEPWRRIALDLNGCNTISVFGVQGSGKSYTVGTVVEMATTAIAGINALPNPLGSVVFHYHPTQDYPPEFASMNTPNDDPGQVQALSEWNAAPAAVQELVILTTADTVEMRRDEFPGVRIEPIAFASSELAVADWRFLMGATGNDALYLKLLDDVMRKARTNLTLSTIRAGLAHAPLSDSQRALAETRLEFAARFIDDSRSLRSLFGPGRLIIVDLRDEFIEKEQALGLFVTMLNVFSGAGLGSDPFNKLIVFDEAHKYMNGALVSHVVEVIREMRHKGVTAVIASQDPVNVPPAIIELSSAVVLHRFNSPNWVRHIQRSLAALGELTPAMLAALAPGESFVWANKATDPTFTRRAVKVRMRPRATKHGGSTRTAVDG